MVPRKHAHKRRDSTRVWCPNDREYLFSSTDASDRVKFTLSDYGKSAPFVDENDRPVYNLQSVRDWYDDFLGEWLSVPGTTYNWRVEPRIAFGPGFPPHPPAPPSEDNQVRKVWIRNRNRQPLAPRAFPARNRDPSPSASSDSSATPEVIVIKDEEDTAEEEEEEDLRWTSGEDNDTNADEWYLRQSSQESTESCVSQWLPKAPASLAPVLEPRSLPHRATKKGPNMSKRGRKLITKETREKAARKAEIEARKAAKREEGKERRATRLSNKRAAEKKKEAEKEKGAAGKQGRVEKKKAFAVVIEVKKASKRGLDEIEVKRGRRNRISRN